MTVDKNKVYDERIRRVSIDKFYEIVTDTKDAFMLLCKQLPVTINYFLDNTNIIRKEKDTVIEELSKINPNLVKALYLIAFKTYNGFDIF